MALVLTIEGVTKTVNLRRGTLRITRRLNNRDTLSATIKDPLSTSGAYRPAIRDVIRVTYDSVIVFEGEIQDIQDAPILEPDRGTYSHVQATGWGELTDRLMINAPYARDSYIHNIANDLVTLRLGPEFGVTAGFSTGVGPRLTFDAAFGFKYCSEVLDQLCVYATADGVRYGWFMTPAKVLNFFELGTLTGPTALTDSNGTAKRLRSGKRATAFYNAAWVLGGGDGALDQREKVNGNGATRLFPVTGTPLGHVGSVEVVISGSPVTYPVGVNGQDDMPYTWDATNRRIVQRTDQPILSASDYMLIPYQEQGPLAVYVEDAASVAADDRRETKIEAPEVTDRFQLRALGLGAIARAKEEPYRVEIVTRTQGWAPGMSTTCSFPNRLISGTFLIEELEIFDQAVSGGIALNESQPNFLTWRLRGVAGNHYQGSWIDYWRNQRGIGAGGGSIPAGGANTGGGGGSVIVGNSLLWANLGGSMTEAVSDASATRHTIPNQVPISIAGSRVNGSVLLRGKVRVSNTATRARLVLRNETTPGDTAVSAWSATGNSGWQYLSVFVTLASSEQVYKVELDVDTAGVDNLYWCAYATLENR